MKIINKHTGEEVFEKGIKKWSYSYNEKKKETILWFGKALLCTISGKADGNVLQGIFEQSWETAKERKRRDKINRIKPAKKSKDGKFRTHVGFGNKLVTFRLDHPPAIENVDVYRMFSKIVLDRINGKREPLKDYPVSFSISPGKIGIQINEDRASYFDPRFEKASKLVEQIIKMGYYKFDILHEIDY